MNTIFEALESEVRSYCRNWPTTFHQASGSLIFDERGQGYLDFFAGAGALNYGHNNPVLKRAIIDYLESDGVTHALDMNTVAKRDFLATFRELVLGPRELDYKVMFAGPGGANSVEAALKLTRKVTGRRSVAHFKHAFHGMTLGALSVAGDPALRARAGIPLTHTIQLPFDGDCPEWPPGSARFEQLLTGGADGAQLPAAVLVETVQGEGGLNVAGPSWLRDLANLCRQHSILLIVDDVQMGCGRTGPFFSFEPAGITPDIVCLSKAIGAFGMPMALTLVRPDLDVWRPGEHNGTFRGLNIAFVAATEALRTYWRDDQLEKCTLARGEQVGRMLTNLADGYSGLGLRVKGRGLARGLEFPDGELAGAVCGSAFERGMLMETSGPSGAVVKLMPPLTVTDDELKDGLAILTESVKGVLG